MDENKWNEMKWNKIQVFLDVIPCQLLNFYSCFEALQHLKLQAQAEPMFEHGIYMKESMV